MADKNVIAVVGATRRTGGPAWLAGIAAAVANHWRWIGNVTGFVNP